MVEDKTPKVVMCSLCPNLRIQFTPGDGRLLDIWRDHKNAVHPQPIMKIGDAGGE